MHGTSTFKEKGYADNMMIAILMDVDVVEDMG